MGELIFGLIGSLISSWFGYSSAARQAEIANEATKEMQEDAQDFEHSERIEQNQYQQQMHEFNVFNDPKLQMQGMVNNGVSAAAAAQAIAGAPSTGYSPTASNNGSPMGAGQQMNPANPFQGISDAINNYFGNKEKESNVVLNQAKTNEVIANIKNLGVQMNATQVQIDLAQQVTKSQIGLNQSQIALNYSKLQETNANVQHLFAQIDNLDAQTISEYVRASMLMNQSEYYSTASGVNRAQIRYTEAQTGVAEATEHNIQAQTELVEQQTQGQIISNLDANIVAGMKQYRLEVSRALGVDVDADFNSQVLEAMAAGRWDTVERLLQARQYDSNELGLGTISRYAGHRAYKPNGVGHQWRVDQDGFSPSFQPVWSPN